MLENTIDLRHFDRSLWDLRKYQQYLLAYSPLE